MKRKSNNKEKSTHKHTAHTWASLFGCKQYWSHFNYSQFNSLLSIHSFIYLFNSFHSMCHSMAYSIRLTKRNISASVCTRFICLTFCQILAWSSLYYSFSFNSALIVIMQINAIESSSNWDLVWWGHVCAVYAYHTKVLYLFFCLCICFF